MSDQPNTFVKLWNWARAINNKLQGYSRAPYVKGLPEWEMFPDELSRQQAMKEIEWAMMPRSLKGVLGFMIAVLMMFGAPMAIAAVIALWLLPWMGVWLGVWNNRLMWILAIVGYTVVVYFAIRGGMPRALRKKLLRCGVPVCLECGYDLRGLPHDRTRCPECGRRFGAQVQKMLESNESTA